MRDNPLVVKDNPLVVKDNPLAVPDNPLAVPDNPLAVPDNPLVGEGCWAGTRGYPGQEAGSSILIPPKETRCRRHHPVGVSGKRKYSMTLQFSSSH